MGEDEAIEVVLIGRYAGELTGVADTIAPAGFALRIVDEVDLRRRVATPSVPSLVVLSGFGADRETIALCKSVRTASDVPLIVIVDRPDEDATIALFDAGADAVVATPLRQHEFVARMRAALRRGPQ